jgi:hypothetical protein
MIDGFPNSTDDTCRFFGYQRIRFALQFRNL